MVDSGCALREEFEPYSTVFDPENGRLSLNNSCFWDVFPADSVGWFGPTPSNTPVGITTKEETR